MGLMAYDRARLDSLRVAMAAALDELSRMRCDDGAAADAMRRIDEARRLLGDRCLPRLRDLLESDPLSSAGASWLNSCAFRQTTYSQLVRLHHWELAQDPLDDDAATPPDVPPEEPWTRSFNDVTTAIKCGELTPMILPTDPSHPIRSQITTVELAPGSIRHIGSRDVTSNWLKLADYASDVAWFGWREHHELSAYYLSDVVVTATVWVVDPVTRQRCRHQQTQAVTSGFILVRDEDRTVELNPPIGGGAHTDPTATPSIPLDHEHVYKGAFYPDTAPHFEPLPSGAAVRNEPTWKFTSKKLPFEEEWGTWDT